MDRFGSSHRILSQKDHEHLSLLKEQATSLCETIEAMPEGRERAIAITKLEEAVMWATKALTA